MSRWRGKLGSFIADRHWRQLVDVLDRRSDTSSLTLEEFRQRELDRYRQLVGDSGADAAEDSPNVYLTSADSLAVRSLLESHGWAIYPLEKSAMSANTVAGWVAAPKRSIGRRRDLAEAFGVRILETRTGEKPHDHNVLDFTGPIDLVYTWVDGSDPEWISARDEFLEVDQPKALPTSAAEARFLSNDELRYSLRSVEAFLPWVNHIYVVTSGQIPEWLDSNHPRLSVVKHEDIFKNTEDLPTFNSHAIESQLHRIPNLSEHFLYMNDDFFFGRPLHKNVFYTPQGFSMFANSNRNYEHDLHTKLPINVAAENNAKLIENQFGLKATLKFKHVAHPQRRSVLTAIEDNHPDLVAQTASAKFRSPTDLSIPSSLAHYYGAALGTAIPRDISYAYIDLGSKNAQLKLTKLLLRRRPQTFCLNQVSGSGDELDMQNAALQHFLVHAFPWKSSYER